MGYGVGAHAKSVLRVCVGRPTVSTTRVHREVGQCGTWSDCARREAFAIESVGPMRCRSTIPTSVQKDRVASA
eukprot:97965-Rhodomonas_salina.2